MDGMLMAGECFPCGNCDAPRFVEEDEDTVEECPNCGDDEYSLAAADLEAESLPVLDRPLRVKSVGHIEFGTIKGLELGTAVGIVDLMEPPPALPPIEPRSISVSFEMNFVKGAGWHYLNNLVKRLGREQFRRMRPYRKAKRRSLSRNRIEATRAWHNGAELRAIYDDLYQEFGIGGYGWEHHPHNPYKGVRPSKQ